MNNKKIQNRINKNTTHYTHTHISVPYLAMYADPLPGQLCKHGYERNSSSLISVKFPGYSSL